LKIFITIYDSALNIFGSFSWSIGARFQSLKFVTDLETVAGSKIISAYEYEITMLGKAFEQKTKWSKELKLGWDG
jgi:hypothetical protein